MPGFFEQMCKIVADSASKEGDFPAYGKEFEKFFSDLPKTETLPAPESVPVAAPESVPSPAAAPAPEPIDSPSPAAAPAPEPIDSPSPAAVASGSLEALEKAAAGCQKCQLCRFRNNIVFGEGDPDARLMFIGEGPGFEEDRQGRPFVGKAGQLLDKMIAAMQFSRQEVYIANIVKCRPPDNRAPAEDEAAACLPYLKRQIELIRPEVIVLLGATAARYLLNVTSGISKMRGRWLSYENIPVMATFHPAYLLRKEEAKREAWSDLQQVMARFGKFHHKPGEGNRH